MSSRSLYKVKRLGTPAGNVENLVLKPKNLKPAPISAFWAHTTIKGHRLKVPSSCLVDAEGRVRVVMDAFAGIDRVIPCAKILLGDDKCDWMNDGEVLSALKDSVSRPLTCNALEEDLDIELKEDEVLVDEKVKTGNSFFKALIEYELVASTDVQVDTEHGFKEIFRVKFPLSEVSDENLFSERKASKPMKRKKSKRLSKKSSSSSSIERLSSSSSSLDRPERKEAKRRQTRSSKRRPDPPLERAKSCDRITSRGLEPSEEVSGVEHHHARRSRRPRSKSSSNLIE